LSNVRAEATIRPVRNLDETADNCPVAEGYELTVYRRVLHRACQIAGSVEKLAVRLRVPTVTLLRWLNGEGEPPTPVFLKAVDIVLSAGTETAD
jgi:hypothetical protein